MGNNHITPAECPRCYAQTGLRPDGTLNRHAHARYSGECPASGKLPASISHFSRPTAPLNYRRPGPGTPPGGTSGPDPSGPQTCTFPGCLSAAFVGNRCWGHDAVVLGGD